MWGARHFRIWRQRLHSILAKNEADDSLSRELAFHIEQLTAEYMAQGLSRRLAREAAMRDFGNPTLYAEEARDQRRVAWLHDLKQDLGYGLRQLRSHRGFALVAIASLALGIGANTAMLGALDAMWTGALPLPDADRLVMVRGYTPQRPGQNSNNTVPEYLAWKERAQSFSSIGLSIANRQDLAGDGFLPERLEGQAVTPSLFRTLGVTPLLGRTFTEEEGRPGNPSRVIVLSHGLWQRLFGGDRAVLNRTIRMDGNVYTIIGVMPEGFWYPIEAAEYWVPIGFAAAVRVQSARLFAVTARLKPDVSHEQAEAEVALIAANLAREFPDRQRDWRARLVPLRLHWFGWLRGPLSILEGASILVLLIACTNIATLLLARASVRRPEFTLRLALGATRWRLARQLFAESLLLAIVGGAASLALTWLVVRVLVIVQPPPGGIHVERLPFGFESLGIAIGLSLLCALLFGAAPALLARTGGARFRNALVATQVSLALILLVSSGLLIKSVAREATEERGFEVDGLLTFDLRLPLRDIEPLRDRLAAIPEVQSASAVSASPVYALAVPTAIVVIEGRPAPATGPERDAVTAVHLTMTPGYLDDVRAKIVRGRGLNPDDTVGSPWAAVINEAMASRFWPGQDPIGQRITLLTPTGLLSGERPREIVGIVRNMTQILGSADLRPVVYTSYRQQPENAAFGPTSFVVRGPRDPLSLANAVRHAAAEFHPAKPVANLSELAWWSASGIVNRGFYMAVLVGFATLATLLAGIGVYGVTAYTVSQRTREIGIRLALGAPLAEIRRLLSRRAVTLIAIGMIAGVAGAAALTRNLSFQLREVSPYDPWVYGAAIALLAFVAFAASFAPTRRARSINPADVLRSE